MAPLSASSERLKRPMRLGTSRPARLATPISVPVASNSSTRKNTSTTLRMPPVSADLMSSCRKRSEEHTSELQSRLHLVCRLLLEKKKKLEKYRPIQVSSYSPHVCYKNTSW